MPQTSLTRLIHKRSKNVRRMLRVCLSLCLWTSVHTTPAQSQSLAVQATFESPQQGPVSGISGIHGWGFSTQPDVNIGAISLFIDNVHYGDIPCCSERADVQVAFPEFAPEETLNSAWGMPFNWGLLSPGPHTIQVEIRSADEDLLFLEERTVSVVKPQGVEFIDQFDLSDALVSIADNILVLSDVVIRDGVSQERQNIHTRFEWFNDSQSFRLIEARAIRSSDALSSASSPLLLFPLAGGLSSNTTFPDFAPQGFIDTPAPGQTVAGASILNGWVLATDSSQEVADIHLLLDGQLHSRIPCCFERADVAAAFPDNPNALSSGWGMTFNYGLLVPGPHTIGVQITDTSGSTHVIRAIRHTVHVVRPGGFEVLDQLDLSQASAQIDGQGAVLTNVRVRDKITQQTVALTLRLRWSVASQMLGIVSNNKSFS